MSQELKLPAEWKKVCEYYHSCNGHTIQWENKKLRAIVHQYRSPYFSIRDCDYYSDYSREYDIETTVELDHEDLLQGMNKLIKAWIATREKRKKIIGRMDKWQDRKGELMLQVDPYDPLFVLDWKDPGLRRKIDICDENYEKAEQHLLTLLDDIAEAAIS